MEEVSPELRFCDRLLSSPSTLPLPGGLLLTSSESGGSNRDIDRVSKDDHYRCPAALSVDNSHGATLDVDEVADWSSTVFETEASEGGLLCDDTFAERFRVS